MPRGTALCVVRGIVPAVAPARQDTAGLWKLQAPRRGWAKDSGGTGTLAARGAGGTGLSGEGGRNGGAGGAGPRALASGDCRGPAARLPQRVPGRGPLPAARCPLPVAAGRSRAMALPGPWRCPWRWPPVLPAALLVAVTSLPQGSLLGAALGAGGAWWALRSRPPARRPLARGSPARFLPPQRPPRLRLPPYRPRHSRIARCPSPWDQAVWRLARERASNGGPAPVIGRRVSAPTRGNGLGASWCDAILPARTAPVFVSPAWQNGLYSGVTAGAVRPCGAHPSRRYWLSRAPPQTVRRQDPLLQDRSPETTFPPKRMCVRESPQPGPGSCCQVPPWTGREWELSRPEDRAPGRANKAVQTEEAVERPEDERRQSPSPPPSPGNGRPCRRSICLRVPGETHPMVLYPELIPGYPPPELILEEEKEAAYQRFRQLSGSKAAGSQGCSGTSRTQAASVTTPSVISGQAASTTAGLTHTTQPGSRSVPVLPVLCCFPETPAPFSGQRPSGLGRDAASSGSSTSASSSRARCKHRACKRHKARIHHFCDKEWPVLLAPTRGGSGPEQP
ncbi:uncharacterized protein LOC136006174 [Lathamus discolor]|uniref:uncharacterized protein LOC136006174 n=1 Tax=Lathamus discolor TaxID=678569 RepID=UPI0032B811F1